MCAGQGRTGRFSSAIVVTGYSSYQSSVARIAGAVVMIGHALTTTQALPLILTATLVAAGWQRRIFRVICAVLILISLIPSIRYGGLISLAQIAGVALCVALLLVPRGEALRLDWILNEGLYCFRDAEPGWQMPRVAVGFALIASVSLGGLFLWAQLVLPDGSLALLSGDSCPEICRATGIRLRIPGDDQGYLLAYLAVLLLMSVNLRYLLPPPRAATQPIVFFDGVCALCNSSVDFIIREDYRRVIRYAPIQGETAARLLSEQQRAAMDSIIFRDSRGREHTRSDAILQIGLQLGGLWKLGAIGLLIPRALRNRLYDLIARNRYRWFGKKESCRLPTPEERELFLL